MTDDRIPSKLLAKAVDQMASLPSVGKRTALRLVLNMLKWEKSQVQDFANSFTNLVNEIKYCKTCHNLSDTEICGICSDPNRNEQVICVVESIRDVMAIEATMQYKGRYHVLGGIIAPMEGIGPKDLTIEALEERAKNQEVQEIILALNASMEGDTTGFYIHKKLQPYCQKVTTLARGISFGDELEFADEVSLGRSLLNRTPYNQSLSQ